MAAPPPPILSEFRKLAARGEKLKQSVALSSGWVLLSDKALYLGQPLDRFPRGEITGVEIDRAGNGPGTMFILDGSDPVARIDFQGPDRAALTKIEKALAPRRRRLQVYLDQKSYAPGERVRGHVELDWPKAEAVRGVRVGLVGSEDTSITITTGMGKNQHSTTYRAQETQIAEEWILFGGERIGWSEAVGEALSSIFGKKSYPVLAAGRHKFEFEFALPDDALPCFEGDHATVTYRLYAVVDIPLGFDQVFEGSLIVGERPDAVVTGRTVEENVAVEGFLQTLPGGLRMGFQIEKCPYHIGERLRVRLRVENGSGKRIRSARIAIYSVESARAEDQYRETTTEIEGVKVKFPEPAAESQDYRLELPIPPWPVPFAGRYSRVDLWLGATLDIAMAQDPSLSVPLEIR